MKVCSHCKIELPLGSFGQTVATKSGYQYDCNKCRSEAGRRKRERDWKAILLAYGGQCVHCEDTREEVLTLDHIGGGGNAHRRSLKKSAGSGFYAWVVLNNFPPFLRLLCFNCNCCLGVRGYLPRFNRIIERREVA